MNIKELRAGKNRTYLNKAEGEFQQLASFHGVEIHRRGYPDYMIIKDGEIIGFVEVKPSRKDKLRKGQEMFKKFCDKNCIPFVKWTPEDLFPTFFKKL